MNHDESQGKDGGIDDSQAADLAALEAAASGGMQVEVMDAEPAGLSEAQQWAMLPKLFGSIVGMAVPEIVPVYSDEACAKWGEAMVPVAAKYGWDASIIRGPELGLALASLPLALGTMTAIKAYKTRVATERAKSGDSPQNAATDAPVNHSESPPNAGVR